MLLSDFRGFDCRCNRHHFGLKVDLQSQHSLFSSFTALSGLAAIVSDPAAADSSTDFGSGSIGEPPLLRAVAFSTCINDSAFTPLMAEARRPVDGATWVTPELLFDVNCAALLTVPVVVSSTCLKVRAKSCNAVMPSSVASKSKCWPGW